MADTAVESAVPLEPQARRVVYCGGEHIWTIDFGISTRHHAEAEAQHSTSTSTSMKHKKNERLFPLTIPRTHYIVPASPLPASARWGPELWLAWGNHHNTCTGWRRVEPLSASA